MFVFVNLFFTDNASLCRKTTLFRRNASAVSGILGIAPYSGGMDPVPETPLIDVAEMLQEMFVSIAQNGSIDDDEYRSLRRDLISRVHPPDLLPTLVRECRSGDMIWTKMTSIASYGGAWAARREFIWDDFRPLLDHLESSVVVPFESSFTSAARIHDFESAQRAWIKAISRKDNDPDGAITAARTLIEAVCKTILDDRGIEYSNGSDLPALYRAVCKELSLSPREHNEQLFKQILGGCKSVVEGIGGLRNVAGDSHGQGRKQYKAEARHAELAVNLAGSMATFLIQTHAASWNKSEAA